MKSILLLILILPLPAIDNMQELTKLLKVEEGFSSTPYLCTRGFLTIGYGHRCSNKTSFLSREEAEQVLISDIKKANRATIELVGENQPDEVKLIVCAMIFQMGKEGVADFKNMLRNIKKGDYKAASINMLHSDWKKQTPARCRKMAAMMAAVQDEEDS